MKTIVNYTIHDRPKADGAKETVNVSVPLADVMLLGPIVERIEQGSISMPFYSPEYGITITGIEYR